MVLALSIGDPSGIGPDIALLAWYLRDRFDVPQFILIGDPHQIEDRARCLELPVSLKICGANDAHANFATALPVLPLESAHRENPGQPPSENAAVSRT